MGGVSKVLFSTLAENDAEYYEEQICHFESNSDDTTELLKQQVYVIKSTLGALNLTIADVALNDKHVKQGLVEIKLTLTHYLQRLLGYLVSLELNLL
jgi:hypothetical protein